MGHQIANTETSACELDVGQAMTQVVSGNLKNLGAELLRIPRDVDQVCKARHKLFHAIKLQGGAKETRKDPASLNRSSDLPRFDLPVIQVALHETFVA
jgi:hypothetical protein